MTRNNHNWLDFIPKLTGWLRDFIAFTADVGGFVVVVAGVIRYWQGETSSTTVALITVGAAIAGIGWLGCLYTLLQRYRHWKAQLQIIVTPRRRRSKPRQRGIRLWLRWARSDRVQFLALLGLVVIPLFAFASLGAGWYARSLPPGKVILLVTDFDGPEPQKYRVTDTVLNNLHQALARYDDVEVKALGRAITEADGSVAARAEGEKHKATIVIWGWYGVTAEAVPLSVHFEVLRPPKYWPELEPEAKGQVQVMAVAELESLTLQTHLSAEMAYLSLFTVGMARYAVGDWDGAITRFRGALSQTAERIAALDQGVVYFYRGFAYGRKGSYDRAIADFNQAIKLKPDLAEAYINRGLAYGLKGDYDRAIADFDQAIKLKPDYYAVAYSNRGLAYASKGDYDRAIADFDQAIKLKPDLAKLYINRGLAHGLKGNYDRAIADFDQAIKLKPNLAEAYVNRGNAYLYKGDYDRAIADFDQGIKLKPNYYAVAYFNRGLAYRLRGEKGKALADFKTFLELGNDPYLRQQAEEELKVLEAR